MFFPKDFIETAEGLLFAVVDPHPEQGKVLCFLRYVNENGHWRKLATDAANAFLMCHYPSYLHDSKVLDAKLHAVEAGRIIRHHQPKHRFQAIMQSDHHDAIERDIFVLGELLRRQGLDLSGLGVTGSLLIGVQKASSDIDLVCYGRDVFQQCRNIVRELIGQGMLQTLNDSDWQESYQRRDCSLSYEDYVWHERRKLNKALVNGRKFDLNLIDHNLLGKSKKYQKMGSITLTCRIVDDTFSFDYPAVYKIEHDTIGAIVCFTATYTGQAKTGEVVEVSGMLEQTPQGDRHIVVGSSREAAGEHIRVIDG